MPGLDRSNAGCSIGGSRERVRLGLKGSDPESSADGSGPGWEQGQGALVKWSHPAWSVELPQARELGIGELRSDKIVS